MWDEQSRLPLYQPDALDRLISSSGSSNISADPFQLLQHSLNNASKRSLVRRAQAVDVSPTGYLAGDLMFKVDIASMAHSLECRSPFLDHRLAEFTARLPDNYLLDPITGKGKKIFARACSDIVPQEIFKRRKMGFAAPVDRWLLGPLADKLSTTLLSPDSRLARLLNPGAIRQVIESHQSGQADHAYRLWSLLVLELWLQRYG